MKYHISIYFDNRQKKSIPLCHHQGIAEIFVVKDKDFYAIQKRMPNAVCEVCASTFPKVSPNRYGELTKGI